MRKRQAIPGYSLRLKRLQPARLHNFLMAMRSTKQPLEGKFTFNIKKLRIQA